MRPLDNDKDHKESKTAPIRRMRGAGHGFEPVAEIADRHVNQSPAAAGQRDTAAVKKIWLDIAGDFIGSNTAITSLKDGNLTITARATPFLFHLRSAKKNYISQINERLRSGAVKEIFYRIGSVKTEAEETTLFDEIRQSVKRDEVMFYEVENIEIPGDVVSSINDFVASLKIADAELVEKMITAAKTIYRVTQYKKRHGYVECAVCSALYYKRGAAPEDGREEAGGGDADTCQYCGFRLSKMMSGVIKRIVEYPWENYEAHTVKFPDTKFREFEYIRKREFGSVKREVEDLVKKFVMSEAPEDFAKLDSKIRLAMSLYENVNYFEVREFGAARLDKMAAVLGPNARAAFTRGAMVAKF
jgi:hypothetical protein